MVEKFTYVGKIRCVQTQYQQLAVRIPKHLSKEHNLRAGQVVTVTLEVSKK